MNATMSLEKTKHYPVMLNQVLSIISPQRGGTYIDCTFGAGGYSQGILKFPNTEVIALDRDKLSESYANLLLKKLDLFVNLLSSNIDTLIFLLANIFANTKEGIPYPIKHIFIIKF